MTNPTSNFGWQMPEPTDLVTNLPADFEVFGQAVDTDFADLNGGTTGQVLSKTSNTDLDFTWISANPGDITEVTVTSPITGGGSSGSVNVAIQNGTTAQKGAVQLENSTSSTSTTTAAVPANVKTANDLAAAAVPKSTVTTNGDLIYGTGSAAVTRLGIGSAAQVLTVSGGVPSWATPAVSASGLVLIQSGTFSATTSIITNAVFSATYKNYLFLMVSTTSYDDTDLRFRAGSSTQVTDYVYAQPGAYNTSPYVAANTGQANGSSFGAVSGGSVGSMSSVFIANPFATEKTLVSYLTPWTQSAGLLVNKTTTGFINNSTSYDKIDITAGANITGHFAVYGYAI